MTNKKYFIIILLTCSLSFAQSIKVIETKQIQIENNREAFYPFFGKSNSQIFFSSNSYKGLYVIDNDSKQLSVISELNGAGYNPIFLDDDQIIYRTNKIIEGKKYQSVYSHELLTGKNSSLEKDERNLKLPYQMQSSNLLLIKENKIEKKQILNSKLAKTNTSTNALYVEDNNLNYVKGNETIQLNPLGKGVYVWESISNDGSMILFSYGNKGAFICDLDGNIIDNIKDAHFPKFSPDDKYVSYMIDIDDGYNYLSSDIYVYSLEMKKSFPITETVDIIEMYPNWSSQGNQLVYNTVKGQLFISTLKFEN